MNREIVEKIRCLLLHSKLLNHLEANNEDYDGVNQSISNNCIERRLSKGSFH